jgi:hypothetical protein
MKRTELYNAMLGKGDNFAAGMLLDNIPLPILANDYTKYLCVASNAVLFQVSKSIDEANNILDITTNQ